MRTNLRPRLEFPSSPTKIVQILFRSPSPLLEWYSGHIVYFAHPYFGDLVVLFYKSILAFALAWVIVLATLFVPLVILGMMFGFDGTL